MSDSSNSSQLHGTLQITGSDSNPTFTLPVIKLPMSMREQIVNVIFVRAWLKLTDYENKNRGFFYN